MTVSVQACSSAAVMQGVISAQGHYLEADCQVSEEAAFTSHRLDSLQGEVRFTHNAVISRLRHRQLIRYCQLSTMGRLCKHMIRTSLQAAVLKPQSMCARPGSRAKLTFWPKQDMRWNAVLTPLQVLSLGQHSAFGFMVHVPSAILAGLSRWR